ncbi:hypothetical protein Pelo_17412 [Pelomyxa schiedti]|nr:hypothetical protein Pelo_17412 [Pelomyxa schiedti]
MLRRGIVPKQRRITIDRVLDARDQALTMLLALCPPPPTIHSRGANRLTNDVARDLAERWVLTPVRRFIVHTKMEFSTVVSIGPTLGVVSTSETNVWTPNHSRLCWLDQPHRLLAYHQTPYRRGEPHSGFPAPCIFDFSPLWGPNVDPIPCPPALHRWGNHKWAVGWDRVQLYVQRVDNKTADGGQAQGFPWVPVTVPVRDTEMRDLDVVFSHSEPALIEGEGDEASMVFGFVGRCQATTDRPRDTLLTVDLARSFSAGALVVVREQGLPLNCDPFIFMDDSGHPVVVQEGGSCSFAVSVWTGERTKLCDHMYATKVSGRLVRIDTNVYDVFTGKVCPFIPVDAPFQPLMDRGLVVTAPAPTPGSFCTFQSVIDAQTGCVLCRCPSRPSSRRTPSPWQFI